MPLNLLSAVSSTATSAFHRVSSPRGSRHSRASSNAGGQGTEHGPRSSSPSGALVAHDSGGEARRIEDRNELPAEQGVEQALTADSYSNSKRRSANLCDYDEDEIQYTAAGSLLANFRPGRQAQRHNSGEGSWMDSIEPNTIETVTSILSDEKVTNVPSDSVTIQLNSAEIRPQIEAAPTFAPYSEIHEERKKNLMLEEHVHQLEKMFSDSVKHGEDLIARNEAMQEDLARRPDGAGKPHLQRASCREFEDNTLNLQAEAKEFQGAYEALHIEMQQQVELHRAHEALQAEMQQQALHSELQKQVELQRAYEALQAEMHQQAHENAELLQKCELASSAKEASVFHGVDNRSFGCGTLAAELTGAEGTRPKETADGGGSGGTSDALELEALVEELQNRNEALRQQVASAQEAEVEVQKCISDKAQLLRDMEALHHELDDLNEKVCLLEEEQSIASRSMEELAMKNKELRGECENMEERIAVASHMERGSEKSSEEAARRIQQLQRQCTSLQESLTASMEAEEESSRSAEGVSRRMQDLQRECTRLRDDAARAEADRVARDSAEEGLPRRDVMQRECKHWRERCEDMEQEKEHLHIRAAESEHRLKEAAEEAAARTMHLQHEVVAMAEGELDARRQVEEGLERNRQLVRQCDQLKEKVAESIKAEAYARQASEDWQMRITGRQVQAHVDSNEGGVCDVDDELFSGTLVPLGSNESSLGESAFVQSNGDNARHKAGTELQKLKVEFARFEQQIGEDQHSKEIAATKSRASCVPALGHGQASEPEIETSPQLNAEHRCAAMGTVMGGGSTVDAVRAAMLQDTGMPSDQRQLRLGQDMAHRTDADQKTAGIVDVNGDVLRFTEELIAKNKSLQQECENLRSEKVQGEVLLPMTTEALNSWGGKRDANSLQREYDQMRQQVASALEFEREVTKLVEQLRDQVHGAMTKEKVSEFLAEDRLRRCHQLEFEHDEMRGELLEWKRSSDITTPLLQEAASAEAWHRCDMLEQECKRLQSQSAVQAKAAMEVSKRHEELQAECAQLKRESLQAGKSALAVQPLLDDATAADAWHRCDELKRECAKLRGKSQENARNAKVTQHLIEDAATTHVEDTSLELELWSCVETSLRTNQHLQQDWKRECTHLREELRTAKRAELEVQEREQSVLALTQRLQSEVHEATLRATRHEEAERQARGASDNGLRRHDQLLQTCEVLRTRASQRDEEAAALTQEIQRLREQAEIAIESERRAQRSAQAATELMRRKDEVRMMKEKREQVARAAEAEKEARRSAAAAVGLKRLIQDLGHVEAESAGRGKMLGLPLHQSLLQSSRPGSANSSAPSSSRKVSEAAPSKTLNVLAFDA